MTYTEICTALTDAGIENARGEATELICHFCGINKAELLYMREQDFDSPELEAAVRRRAERFPLQYILGYWSFWNETYRVTEDTLIPRQDTEKLVEMAIKLIPQGARFIDLCTGSGCVAISVLASRPDTFGVAADLFEKTLEIAGENAESNGVGERLGFLQADVLSPSFMDNLGKFQCIISNPPYIETRRLGLLDEELFCEPQAALDGGEDGLLFYRAIIENYGKYLTESGTMLLEIGCDQAHAVTQIAHAAGFRCEVFLDFGGNDRVAYLTKSSAPQGI